MVGVALAHLLQKPNRRPGSGLDLLQERLQGVTSFWWVSFEVAAARSRSAWIPRRFLHCASFASTRDSAPGRDREKAAELPARGITRGDGLLGLVPCVVLRLLRAVKLRGGGPHRVARFFQPIACVGQLAGNSNGKKRVVRTVRSGSGASLQGRDRVARGSVAVFPVAVDARRVPGAWGGRDCSPGPRAVAAAPAFGARSTGSTYPKRRNGRPPSFSRARRHEIPSITGIQGISRRIPDTAK